MRRVDLAEHPTAQNYTFGTGAERRNIVLHIRCVWIGIQTRLASLTVLILNHITGIKCVRSVVFLVQEPNPVYELQRSCQIAVRLGRGVQYNIIWWYTHNKCLLIASAVARCTVAWIIRLRRHIVILCISLENCASWFNRPVNCCWGRCTYGGRPGVCIRHGLPVMAATFAADYRWNKVVQ